MKKISEWTTVMKLMENGKFAPEFSDFIKTTINELHTQSEEMDGAKIKGSVTLKLNFEIADNSLKISTAMDSKVPKRPRRPSHFFVIQGGEVSTEHPQQHDMFMRPVSDDRGIRG